MDALFSTFFSLAPFLFFCVGAVLASFIGVVAERVYTGQSFVNGRSHCNSCSRPLNGFDLVPIVSWVSSGGRCRTCKAQVPGLYAASELILGLLFAFSYVRLGPSLCLALFVAALVVLLFIVEYDMRHTVVPSSASTLLALLSLGVAVLSATDTRALGLTLLLSGVIGLLFFLMFALSGGRAMGLGDAPVALALSLLTGSYAIAGVLFSFWIGAVWGIAILATRPRGHRMGIEVPFVPFLAAGFLLAFFTTWNPLLFSL